MILKAHQPVTGNHLGVEVQFHLGIHGTAWFAQHKEEVAFGVWRRGAVDVNSEGLTFRRQIIVLLEIVDLLTPFSRTTSLSGRLPSLIVRRTTVYEPVSTSRAKVERWSSSVSMKGLMP